MLQIRFAHSSLQLVKGKFKIVLQIQLIIDCFIRQTKFGLPLVFRDEQKVVVNDLALVLDYNHRNLVVE